MNIALLKKLTETPGIPGREERVRELIQIEARSIFDSQQVDAMGNLLAVRKASKRNARRVLLACHMDQIGFYVRHVDDRGFARLNAAGGFDPRALISRQVRVQASQGGDMIGVLTPTGRGLHIAREEDRKRTLEVGDFYIDFCLPGDVVKKRVRIGDPVTLLAELREIGDCITSQAMDNRIACFVGLEAVRKVKKPAYEIVFGATVQEEVGLRGAGPAAYSQKPDIAIGIDTTLCCDTPGVPEDERVTKQGDGVALTIMDGSAICDRPLLDSFEAVAKKKKIPCQLSILPRGGTDTAAMQRTAGGIRAMTYSVPTRYIHTVCETIHKKDLQAAIDLLAAWLET